jgi:hypothetical protein
MKKFMFGCMFLILATLVFGQIEGSGQRGEMPSDVRYNTDRYARIEFSGNTFTFEQYYWTQPAAPVGTVPDESFNYFQCRGTYTLDGDKITMSWSGTISSTIYSYNLFGSRKKGSTTSRSYSETTAGDFHDYGSGFSLENMKGTFSRFFNGSYD